MNNRCKRTKKYTALMMLMVLTLLSLVGCGAKSEETSSENKKTEAKTSSVAVLLPSQSNARWAEEGEAMKKELEDKGYSVTLLYADDAASQVSQMEDLVAQDIDGVLIAPVDAKSLGDTLAKADKSKIPVVAYDSLPMNCKGVSYYIGFDYEKAGTMIGNYIVEKAGLEELAKQEDKTGKTIEFFLRDNTMSRGIQEYNGIMAVLNPYIENGTLICTSERTSQEDVQIQSSSADIAKEYCAGILAANYADKNLDIVCTDDDTIAAAVKDSLESGGYVVGGKWPILTGEGGSATADKLIASGAQNMTLRFDTSNMMNSALTVFEACMEEKEPELDHKSECDNGTEKITAYLEEPQLVE